MRPIKYQAWHKANRKMYAVAVLDFAPEERGVVLIIEPFHTYGPCSMDEVELREFIGLFDKNDKEIYGGDILQDWRGVRQEVVWFVEPHYVLAGWTLRPIKEPDVPVGGYAITSTSWLRAAVVIGNIYENPELLGQKAREG